MVTLYKDEYHKQFIVFDMYALFEKRELSVFLVVAKILLEKKHLDQRCALPITRHNAYPKIGEMALLVKAF
jgi:hypothetical protein